MQIILPEWAKTTLFFIGLSIVWDCVRTIIQVLWTSHLTKKLMRIDFTQLTKAVKSLEEDVEEAIEEENNEE